MILLVKQSSRQLKTQLLFSVLTQLHCRLHKIVAGVEFAWFLLWITGLSAQIRAENM